MTITTCYRTSNGTICQTLEDAEVQDAAERLLNQQPDAAHAHLQRWLGGREQLLKV